LGRVQGDEFIDRFLQHRGVDDRVAAIDCLGLVACQLHRGRSRHTGAFKVTYGGSPEVVYQTTWKSCGLARFRPGASEVLDSASCFAASSPGRMDEHPRDDHPLRLLNLTHELALSFQDPSQLRRKRKIARVAVLAFPWLQSQLAIGKINVAPLAGQ